MAASHTLQWGQAVVMPIKGVCVEIFMEIQRSENQQFSCQGSFNLVCHTSRSMTQLAGLIARQLDSLHHGPHLRHRHFLMFILGRFGDMPLRRVTLAINRAANQTSLK